MKRKICVVVTARPSYSRIKTALTAIQAHPQLELQLVVAASALLDRYGTASRIMEADGFPITARIFSLIEGETLITSAKTVALGLLELSTVFENLRPDFVVTVADRYETISTAIAASFMNIPLVHVQGGEVTGNIDEKVRHSITKLADLHFVASESARQRVLRLGEEESAVFNTGCPSIDLAANIAQLPKLPFDPYAKYGGVGGRPDLGAGYLVVMQHSVTTEPGEARRQVEQTLAAISAINRPALWFWPNVDAGSDDVSKAIRSFRERDNNGHIHFFKNMEPEDFLALLKFSDCLVGNSSVGIRECSFLGVPTVNIGSRQNRRDRGPNVIDVDYDAHDITAAVRTWLKCDRPQADFVYGGGAAGRRIADLLAELPPRFHKTITY
jgi:UDP-hydrolysing UDP-N-acetyl-D-glucosamine 2-epimerase